jgi:annexin A7/11
MKGLGTNEKQLIRVIVIRSEVDMQDIKKRFEVMYGQTLKEWIEDDTSGNFKNALLALIQEY